VRQQLSTLMGLQTLQAIGWHSPTFLLDQAWLEQPWRLTSKEPFDKLLDILLKLLGILEKADEKERLQSQTLFISLLEIIDLLWDLDADLERWCKVLERGTRGPFYQTRSSTLETPADSPEKGKLFPIAFHSPYLHMAHTLLLYWAGQVMVWWDLTRAYQKVTGLLGTIDKTTSPNAVEWRPVSFALATTTWSRKYVPSTSTPVNSARSSTEQTGHTQQQRTFSSQLNTACNKRCWALDRIPLPLRPCSRSFA
jgi:hypothetical protein